MGNSFPIKINFISCLFYFLACILFLFSNLLPSLSLSLSPSFFVLFFLPCRLSFPLFVAYILSFLPNSLHSLPPLFRSLFNQLLFSVSVLTFLCVQFLFLSLIPFAHSLAFFLPPLFRPFSKSSIFPFSFSVSGSSGFTSSSIHPSTHPSSLPSFVSLFLSFFLSVFLPRSISSFTRFFLF